MKMYSPFFNIIKNFKADGRPLNQKWKISKQGAPCGSCAHEAKLLGKIKASLKQGRQPARSRIPALNTKHPCPTALSLLCFTKSFNAKIYEWSVTQTTLNKPFCIPVSFLPGLGLSIIFAQGSQLGCLVLLPSSLPFPLYVLEVTLSFCNQWLHTLIGLPVAFL